MSKNIILVLMYHRHKLLDLICDLRHISLIPLTKESSDTPYLILIKYISGQNRMTYVMSCVLFFSMAKTVII
jgi:hypothetical protein